MNIKNVWGSICKAADNFFQSPSMSELTAKEIAERMRPVPYESMKDKLPTEFAKNVGRILEKKKITGGEE